MRFGCLLVAAAGLVVLSSPAGAHQPSQSIFRLLRDQGFSRPLGSTSHIRRLGALLASNRRYEVFYYDYVNPESRHGRQSVILIENGTHYVGAYEANMAKCAVQHNAVLCRDDDAGVQSFRLTQGLPPKKVLIGGEISEFYK